jgi:phosphoribosylaminoimidazolecarboxamide formyltransferase / IMP cyclohydrolase
LAQRALLSVSDKTGLIELANALLRHNIALISTGGTAKALSNAGLPVQDVSEITGFPEMMDGRVKTLHPKVHGGLLALRGNAEHEKAQREHGIENIDYLIVNLYPFEATIAKNASWDDTIENIDIGGPAMIRAAAKNHDFVSVIVDPKDYSLLIEALDRGGVTKDERRKFAATAYARTASYDAAIANWLNEELKIESPPFIAFGGSLAESLRYGENPHQQAAFYKVASRSARAGVSTARQVQGKQLSYNNINDTDAAFELVSEFSAQKSAVAIIKHANPCGVAVGGSLLEAYEKAFACDTTSAFGGIVALNQALDGETAKKIVEIFTEVIIAPYASDEAIALIAAKKNLRLLLTGGLANPRDAGLTVKSVAGGLLVQSRDNLSIDDLELKVVTKRQPTAQELEDLRFAFRVCKHVKSNTIIYARGGQTLGIGAGQMSRVDAARIAVRKAQDAGLMLQGCAVASDAFFPFADGLLAAAEAGATCVIQPGGSMRDDEVIAAANAHNLAMVLTGVRHFRH